MLHMNTCQRKNLNKMRSSPITSFKTNPTHFFNGIGCSTFLLNYQPSYPEILEIIRNMEACSSVCLSVSAT